MDNGILQVTISNPDGIVTGIQYNGIDNLLAVESDEADRGYNSSTLFIIFFFFSFWCRGGKKPKVKAYDIHFLQPLKEKKIKRQS